MDVRGESNVVQSEDELNLVVGHAYDIFEAEYLLPKVSLLEHARQQIAVHALIPRAVHHEEDGSVVRNGLWGWVAKQLVLKLKPPSR